MYASETIENKTAQSSRLVKLPFSISLLFLSLSFSNCIFSQFAPEREISRTTHNAELYVYDINGDQDPDIIGANSTKIFWFENLGNNEFGSIQMIYEEFASHGFELEFADWDMDSDLDIFIRKQGETDLFLMENIESGIFGSPEVLIDNSISTLGFQVVDVNSDGELDIIGWSGIDGIIWYENEGEDTYSWDENYVYSGDSWNFILTDMNDDELVDIVVQTENGIVILHFNGFSFGSLISVDSNNRQLTETQAKDIDGDGDLELLYAEVTNDSTHIGWLKNLGDDFEAMDYLVSLEQSLSEFEIQLEDINGDELPDLIYNSVDGIFQISNLGDGNFSDPELIISYEENLTGLSQVFLASGDFDGDGELEILRSSRFTGIDLLDQIGGGNYEKLNLMYEISSFGHTVAFDFNEDELVDLLVIDKLNNQLVWYQNTGNLTFSSLEVLIEDLPPIKHLESADLDSDGDMDLIFSNDLPPGVDENRIFWYENLGNMNFAPPTSLFSGMSYSSVFTLADIDNDSDLDIISPSNWLSINQLVLIKNQGFGVFSEPENIVSFPWYFSPIIVEAEDFDSDGLKDLVCGSFSSVYYNKNLDNYTFDESLVIAEYPIVDNLEWLSLADINSDDNPDVILSSQFDGVFWIESFGDGDFGDAANALNLNNWMLSAHISSDIDQDGDQDLIAFRSTGSWQNDNLQIVSGLNNGNGYFSQGNSVPLPSGSPHHPILVDFDNDDDLDLVINYTYSEDRLSLLENETFNTVGLSGLVFFDEDQNGILSEGEYGLANIALFASSQEAPIFSDSLGQFELTLNGPIGSNSLATEIPEFWVLTTDPDSYDYQIGTDLNQFSDLNFGLYPDSIQTNLELSFANSFPTCGTNINYWFSVFNSGTTNPTCVVELSLDTDVSYVSSELEPDSIDGQSIYWHFDSLNFFVNFSNTLEISIPDEIEANNDIFAQLTVYELNQEGNVVYQIESLYSHDFTCSDASNYLEVNPVGEGESGFINNDQELIYTIYYENTSNEDATLVEIRNQLDSDLDWSTFDFISSSHPVSVGPDVNGEIVFDFDNLVLPDSDEDELESQGYVSFAISPLDDLDPNTLILNQAYIDFDNQGLISTNTTQNRIACTVFAESTIQWDDSLLTVNISGNYDFQWMLNGEPIEGEVGPSLEPVVNGVYSVLIIDEYGCEFSSSVFDLDFLSIQSFILDDIKVYPNPFNSVCLFQFSLDLNEDYDFLLYNSLGVEVLRYEQVTGNSITVNQSQIGRGVFIATLVNRENGNQIKIDRIVGQ